MAQLDYADAVAIFQLVYYSPCLIGSIFVAGRNGAQKSSGWFFLCIFGLVRIIGAAARLATISHPKTDTAYTIALVCSELGLSPLLMASLGLLSRAYYSILKQPWSTIFSLVIFKIVHTPAVVGLILCIVGATDAKTPADIDLQSTVRIGTVLFAVVWVMLLILTVGAVYAKRKTGQEKGC